MSKRLKIVGINDDQTTCDICGKAELTRVVWFEDLENGEVFAAGVVCASKVQGKTVGQINREIKDYKDYQLKCAREATRALRKAYHAMLDSAPRGDIKARLDYINASQEKIAFYAACEDAANKYNVEAMRLHH